MASIDMFPKDVVTLIFTMLSNQSRLSLLAAIPQLATLVDWGALYHQKYNPLMIKFRALHAEYFPITKKERLDAMLNYYSKTKMTLEYDEISDDDYNLRNIPIIDSAEWRINDYVNSIDDEIYDDILRIKAENQGV